MKKNYFLFVVFLLFFASSAQSQKKQSVSSEVKEIQVSKSITKNSNSQQARQFAPSGVIRCYSAEHNQERQQNGLAPSDNDFENWLAPKIQDFKRRRLANPNQIQAVISIPVVVHVIHNGDTYGTGENITDEQLLSQIQVMNQDYRRMAGTPGFGPGVDVEIEFCMAQTDPSGNPTNGINRVNFGVASWDNAGAEGTLKPSTQWNPNNYLNMWTCRFGGDLNGVLGYAQFPDASGLGGMTAIGGAANTDGVIMAFNAFGSSDIYPAGSYAAPYDKGRTTTHEVGHWLGLRHIWGDGGCTVDDFCADTPLAAASNFGCPTGTDSCPGGGVDQIENYMDYTDDACMDRFTQDQKDRMLTVMSVSPRRASLASSTACQSPAPYIQFGSTTGSIIEDSSCAFTDYTFPVNILDSPSANAIVTFNVGAGTATQGFDYSIVNTSVTFPAGSTASQNLTVRVFNDGLVEPNETIIINLSLNANDFAIGFTVTSTTTCNQYSFTPNLAIPDGLAGGGNGTVVGFNTNIPVTPGVISDVNILDLNMAHTWMSDILLALNHPDGTQVSYVNNVCSDRNGFNNTDLDSQSANAFNCGANTNSLVGAGPFRPSSTFDVYNGKPGNGTWTFLAVDTFGGDTGTLNSLILEICTTETTIEEAPNACGVLTTTWNGSSWSNGAPLKNVVAIFNSNYTSTGDIEACSVIVNTGANVTIASAHTLIVGNEVTVNGTGTLTVENNAALRQINGEAVNTGNIIVRKNSEPMIRQDYTAWSSPVAAQQLQSFSPNTLPNRFYEYLYTGTTTPTAYQSVTPTTNFLTGKGYMIRSADNSSPTVPAVHAGQYTGVPFNGDLSISLGKGYNLLGNPYASPIDADRFLYDNETTIGALYFWTHTVPASGGSYPVNNFASYTTLGGAASAAGGATPNGRIQTGQGFYVRTFDFGSANFSNLQRVNASASTQFFRTSSEEVLEVEKHRIWLNLNDANNKYNQILVGYMDGATNAADNMIDGLILDDSNSVIYSTINSDKYVIQGKSLPFTSQDIVPLGFKAVTSGVYNISLESVDGLFTNQDVFLRDKYTNITHDIKQSEYEFTTQDGIFADRFEIVYENSPLSNDDFINSNDVLVYTQNSQIQVNSLKENIKTVSVYDVLGRNIFRNENVGEKELSISSIKANNQALFIKVTLTTGELITKKVIF